MQRRNRLPALALFALCATGAGSMLNVPSAWAVVQRAVKLIGGTGVTVSASDNATTGQQEWTVNSTVTGGVSSVTGAGTVSCSPTTGAVVCTGSGSGVSSVTGTSPIVASPTTGAVAVSLSTVPATLGGTGVSSPTAHNVAVAEGASAFAFVPPATAGIAMVSNGISSDPGFSTVLPVGGGTGLNSPTAGSVLITNGSSAMTLVAPGTAGNVLQSSGGAWVSGALPMSSVNVQSGGGALGAPLTIVVGSFTTLKSATFSMPTTGALLIWASIAEFSATGTSGIGPYQLTNEVDLDGSSIGSWTTIVPDGSVSSTAIPGGAVTFSQTGTGSGSHTVVLKSEIAFGSGLNIGGVGSIMVLGTSL